MREVAKEYLEQVRAFKRAEWFEELFLQLDRIEEKLDLILSEKGSLRVPEGYQVVTVGPYRKE